jgi:hypothetical protein
MGCKSSRGYARHKSEIPKRNAHFAPVRDRLEGLPNAFGLTLKLHPEDAETRSRLCAIEGRPTQRKSVDLDREMPHGFGSFAQSEAQQNRTQSSPTNLKRIQLPWMTLGGISKISYPTQPISKHLFFRYFSLISRHQQHPAKKRRVSLIHA